MKIKSTRLENYSMFLDNNEIGGDGANNPLFVGILLFLYAIILTASIVVSPTIFIAAAFLIYYTKNPFRFRFYRYVMNSFGSARKFQYNSHSRFSLLGIDIYVLNGYIFSPTKEMKRSLRVSFDLLEKQLNSISA